MDQFLPEHFSFSHGVEIPDDTTLCFGDSGRREKVWGYIWKKEFKFWALVIIENFEVQDDQLKIFLVRQTFINLREEWCDDKSPNIQLAELTVKICHKLCKGHSPQSSIDIDDTAEPRGDEKNELIKEAYKQLDKSIHGPRAREFIGWVVSKTPPRPYSDRDFAKHLKVDYFHQSKIYLDSLTKEVRDQIRAQKREEGAVIQSDMYHIKGLAKPILYIILRQQ